MIWLLDIIHLKLIALKEDKFCSTLKYNKIHSLGLYQGLDYCYICNATIYSYLNLGCLKEKTITHGYMALWLFSQKHRIIFQLCL